jgi:hypothetical protein
MSPAQKNNLTQSIEKAREMLNSVDNPMDALSKANLDPGFLRNIKGYLNSRTASIFLPLMGIDKKVALEKINSLEKMMSKDRAIQSPNEFITSSSNMSHGDDLERFRKGLTSFK